jgi:hypothetical protein
VTLIQNGPDTWQFLCTTTFNITTLSIIIEDHCAEQRIFLFLC